MFGCRVHVRQAEIDDCQDVFDWRNDSVSRQMFHNRNMVTWEEHLAWFENTLNSDRRKLLMCLDPRGEKLAVVRFDIEEACAEVSINMNPAQRGKGFGKICLGKAIGYFIEQNSERMMMRAEIKEENIASKKSFEAAGFHYEKSLNGVAHYHRPI